MNVLNGHDGPYYLNAENFFNLRADLVEYTPTSPLTATDVQGAIDQLVAGVSPPIASDTLWQAKGDLAVGTGLHTAQRLPVGSNGQVTVADSTQTTGVKWADPSVAVSGITGAGAGVLTWLAAPSSANLLAAMTNKTGTGLLVFGTSPTLTTASLGSSTATTQAPSDGSTKIATTAYVDAAVVTSPVKSAADYATTAALPTVTYSNGASGVGATLTATANGALVIDGGTLSNSQRLLVKNQASTFQNGIYTVTDHGSAGTLFILTRTTDFDQNTDISVGQSILTINGTSNAGTTWSVNSASSPTMGTSAITFGQTAGPGLFTSGNGITITGTSIAIDTSVTVDKTTAQVLTNKDLSSGTNTFPTFNQNTTGSAAKWTTARLIAGNSVDGSSNVAFANKFIAQGTADTGLSAAQFLGALATGILKVTTATGVLSVAAAGDFPTLNQSTTGNAATATALATPRTIGGNSFDGTTNITVASATAGFTVSGGNLALGANNLTLTGDVGSTGVRSSHGWFTDLTVTNTIAASVTGNAASATILQTARNIYGNTFNGSADVTGLISATYGGTNNAFFQVSGPASSIKTFTFPNSSAAVLTDASPVTAVQGGTGIASYTIGDILYASAIGALSKLAAVATGNVLISQGSATAPVWGKIDLGSHVTGTLLAAQFPALTGDVTTTAGSLATTIGSGRVTFAMHSTGSWSDDITLAGNSSVKFVTEHAAKTYADNLVTGLKFKLSCVAASTGNVIVSSPSTFVFDGVTLSVGNRLLLKNQTTQSENGPYIFNGPFSAMTRTTDGDTGAELVSATFPVDQGTVNQDTWWTITNDSITIGVTNIAFTQTGGAGTYNAGSGLNLSGNTFSIATGGVTNAMLAGAIAYSKLSLTGAILNADLAGAIAYSKLSLTGSVTNGDLAGGIAYSKLNLTNTLATGDYTASSVTLAKIQNAAASSKLLGSGSSGIGTAYTEITLGSGLSMVGTTLSSSVSGLSIGNAVSGGGANRVLYEDPSQNLAASSNMTFDGSKLFVAGSTTSSTFAVGSMEAQSYTLSNSWIGDNLYFSITDSQWRARATAPGSIIRFLNGGIVLDVASSVSAGAIPTLTDALYVDVTGKVGVGTVSPSAQFHVINTSEQVRVGYDPSNYFKTAVGSTGSVTFDLNGTSPTFNFSKAITSPTFITPILGQPSSGNLTSCTALPFPSGVTLASQNPNVGFFGPASGGSAAPTFRALVANDIPNLSSTYVTLTNTVWLAQNQDVYLDSWGTLANALSHNAGQIRLIVTSQYSVASSDSTPTRCVVAFRGTGSFTVASGQTLTINSLEPPPATQVFFGLGNVILGKNAVPSMNASWWAGITGTSDDNHAFDQITTTLTNNGGGTVDIGLGTWRIFNWTPPSGTVVRGSGQTFSGASVSNATILTLSNTSTAGSVVKVSQAGFAGVKFENIAISTGSATVSSCLILTGTSSATSYLAECSNVTFHSLGSGAPAQVYVKDGGGGWELNELNLMHCSWITPVNSIGLFCDTSNTSINIENSIFQMNSGAAAIKASNIGNLRISSSTINGFSAGLSTPTFNRQITASLSGTALTAAYGVLSISDIGCQVSNGGYTGTILALTPTGATMDNSSSFGSSLTNINRWVPSTINAKAAVWLTGNHGTIHYNNNRDEGLQYTLLVDGGPIYNPISLTNNIVQARIRFNSSATVHSSGNDYYSNTFEDGSSAAGVIISTGDRVSKVSLSYGGGNHGGGTSLTTPQLWGPHDGVTTISTEFNGVEGLLMQTMNMPLSIVHGAEFAYNPESTVAVFSVGSCSASGATKPQIRWGEADQYSRKFTNYYDLYRDHNDGLCYFKGSQTGFVGYVFDSFLRPGSMADASAPNNSVYFSTTSNKLTYKDSGGVSNSLY